MSKSIANLFSCIQIYKTIYFVELANFHFTHTRTHTHKYMYEVRSGHICTRVRVCVRQCLHVFTSAWPFGIGVI